MTEHVTVAIDGGSASRAAVEWALDRARTVPLSLELTTVIELGWTPAGEHDDDFRPAYERALSEASLHVRQAAPSLKSTTVVRRGRPVDELARASAAADILVIGTNKTGVLAGAVYGTLPLRLAAHTRCPVVVVPLDWEPREGHVVAGMEDDGTADVALDFAAREASRLGRALDIVHTWTIPMTIGMDFGSTVPVDSLREAHERILSGSARRIRAAYPGLQVNELVEKGAAAPALVEAARAAAMLVVGTHRRGAVAGLILGSVSHDVLLNLPCPVAVVPHPEEKPHSE